MATLEEFSYEDIKRMTNGFTKEIGRGGAAKVYEGQLKGKTVAVKTIEGYTSFEKNMFEKEKSMLSLFSSHENIVKCLGYGETKVSQGSKIKVSCLILEHLPYSLHNVIEGEIVITWADFKLVMIQVSTALEFIHSHKRHGNDPTHVYVDLKPQNIMFNKDDQRCTTKLIDLGSIIRTRTTADFYTKEYAAPEVIKVDRSALTSKTDVFSLGKTMMEVVCMEKHITVEEVKRRRGRASPVQRIYKDELGFVSRYVRDMWHLSKREMIAISEIITDCTKVAPNQRPTMKEVEQRLRNLE